MTVAYNLLTEPLLSWRDAARHRYKATLPGILERLASGELADFPRLRAHQFDPWCMFLTQLAAHALHRANATDANVREEEWRARLLVLTEGAHEPWCMVVDDLSKPAFFQPPVPEMSIESWKGAWEHPDDLDVLVTSKGHDVKRSLITSDDVEAWITAIVSLQTMQGYAGGSGGYNRVSRMKGGYGSRPRIGLAPDGTVSRRFSRDLSVLIESWPNLLARGFSDLGVALTWLPDWDGRLSLTLTDLAPHFVEVCRRFRLRHVKKELAAAHTTTLVRRCIPESEDGDVGDPWIPIERDGGALTVGPTGFRYQLMSRILFEGDFELASAQRIRPEDVDPMFLFASVLSRGKSKTEGLHDRDLVLPVRKGFGNPTEWGLLGRRATAYVQQAQKMRQKVLFPALTRIARGEQVVEDSFDDRADEDFFVHLFASIGSSDDDAQLAWDRRIREIAWRELQRAIDRCCVPSERWYRAVSCAEAAFHGALRSQFPTLAVSLTNRAEEDNDG